jgi:hypothetical protein
MKINPMVYGVLVVCVFLGVIVGFQQAGVWSTSGKVDGAGKTIQPSAADVNTIKGWMTLEQVSATFGIPVPDILSAFNLPSDTPASTPLKDLESDSFDIVSLRSWLQTIQQTQP